MKALKGLLIYIGIVLGIIVGIGLILVCIMYFVPSFRIGGVGFIHGNKSVSSTEIVLDEFSDYEKAKITITAKTSNITIVPTSSDNINYNLSVDVFGVSTDIVEYSIVKNVYVKNNILNVFLTVTEPAGLYSVSGEGVKISVPEKLLTGIVTNTQSGNVSIGDSEKKLKLDMLSISSSNGGLSLNNVATGDDGSILSLNSLYLKTNTGTFDFSDIKSVTVVEGTQVEMMDGKVIFNELFGAFEATGTGVRIDANQILTGSKGFSAIVSNGYFNIKSLGTPVGAENTIIAENIDMNIDQLYGNTGIVSNFGDIDIGTIDNYCIIQNTNGNVSVGKAKDYIMIETDMGNITVNSYLKSGKFVSDRGNITVVSDSDYVDGYFTEIRNVDGNVKVYNKINKLLLTTTGRSKVEVTFEKVKEGLEKVFQHRINTSTQGNCVVYLPTVNVPPYRFIAKGIISGSLWGEDYSSGDLNITSSETEQYFPNENYKNETMFNACFEFIGKIQFKGYMALDN